MFNESCRRERCFCRSVRQKIAVYVSCVVNGKDAGNDETLLVRVFSSFFSLSPHIVAAFIILPKSRRPEFLLARCSAMPCFMHNAMYKSNFVQTAHTTLTFHALVPFVRCRHHCRCHQRQSHSEGKKNICVQRRRDEFESLVNFANAYNVHINHRTKNMNIYIMADGGGWRIQ